MRKLIIVLYKYGGEARGGLTPYTPPREILVATSSWSNFEALAMCVVLPHSCVAFHPCTCGLRRGADVLIGYDNVEVVVGMTEETIVNDYFIYTDTRLRWIAAPTLLPLLNASSGNDT
jgi:hypothetical protein